VSLAKMLLYSHLIPSCSTLGSCEIDATQVARGTTRF